MSAFSPGQASPRSGCSLVLSLPNSVCPGLGSQGLVASQVALGLVASELVALVLVALGSCIQELLENLLSQGLEFPVLVCHRYFQVGSAASWDSAGSPPRPTEEPWGPWALEVELAVHKGNTVGGSGSNRPPSPMTS